MKLLRSTPALRTADYDRSRRFYRKQLNYTVAEECGNPAGFGILKRDGSTLFIKQPLESTSYCMRELEICDPDGNVICFGEEEPSDND